MIVTDGKAWPAKGVQRWRHKLWGRLQETLQRQVEVRNGSDHYRFHCSNLLEYARCAGLFVKEAGTCAWIAGEVKPGEVFYDVGANIGIYSVLAGFRVGPGGRVFAFEPHGATFGRLIENIAANGLQDIVVPCSFALNDSGGLLPFNYASHTPGTSNSQLASRQGSREETFEPVVSELKYATTIDDLTASGALPPPDHVKIDVDGNEWLILKGMEGLLAAGTGPRTIQIEMNHRHKDEFVPYLESHGYQPVTTHYSRTALKRINKGEDPNNYAYNIVFRKDQA